MRKLFRVIDFPSAAGAGEGDEGGQAGLVVGAGGSRVRSGPTSLCLQLSAEARGKTWLFVHEWETLQPRGHQLSDHVGEHVIGEPDVVELRSQAGYTSGSAQPVGQGDSGALSQGRGGRGGGAEAMSGGGMGTNVVQAREKGDKRVAVKKVAGAGAAPPRNDGCSRGMVGGAPGKRGMKRARPRERESGLKEEAETIQVSGGLEAGAARPDQAAAKSAPPADAAVPPPPPSVGATFLFKFDGAHWSPVRLLRQAGCRNPKEWLAIRAELETRAGCAAAGDTPEASDTPAGDAAETAAATAEVAAEVEKLIGARPRRAAPVKRYDSSISSAELSRRKREEARRDEERRKKYWWAECLDSPVATPNGLVGRHLLLELAADTWGELWMTPPHEPRLHGSTA